MGYDAPPALLLQKCPNGILPYGVHSPEMLDGLVIGQVLTCTLRRNRTIPRNAAYWAGLQRAVKATDAWPTPSHLHDDLKRLCGYVERYSNPLTGREEERVQSTALDRMNESEFSLYFNSAQARFIALMGFGPWDWRTG